MILELFYNTYETPEIKAINFYFEKSEKDFKGRPRETLVTTLNKDIKREKSIKRDILLPTFKKKEDFEVIRSKAPDRKDWRRISEIVCKAATT